MKIDLAVNYTTPSVFYTSAVYAFKAGCDMQSVASIVSFGKALDMFRNPTKYDCFQPRESRSVNDYFDMLNFGEEPTIN